MEQQILKNDLACWRAVLQYLYVVFGVGNKYQFQIGGLQTKEPQGDDVTTFKRKVSVELAPPFSRPFSEQSCFFLV